MLGALRTARLVLGYLRKLPPETHGTVVDIVRGITSGRDADEQRERAARAAAALGIRTAFREHMRGVKPVK